MFDRGWVISKNTKIVNWVAVNSLQLDLFVIVEQRLSNNRTLGDYMPIGQDQTFMAKKADQRD